RRDRAVRDRLPPRAGDRGARGARAGGRARIARATPVRRRHPPAAVRGPRGRPCHPLVRRVGGVRALPGAGALMREAVVGVLLFSGVAVELFCCAGVVAMRGPYDRLHYTAPAGFGVALVAAAILVHEGFSIVADKALLLAAIVLFLSPLLV